MEWKLVQIVAFIAVGVDTVEITLHECEDLVGTVGRLVAGGYIEFANVLEQAGVVLDEVDLVAIRLDFR